MSLEALTAALPSFLNSNPKVDAATTDDDHPTPGHLYLEIAEMTFQGGAVSERLLTHLLRKLENGSPAVKIKVLMVMYHTIEKGHHSFLREAAKNAEKIRPCLDFRGPPDPVLGDRPYVIVRERAQAVMNAFCDFRDVNRDRPVAVGMGSGPVVHLTPSTGKTMVGFGNTTGATYGGGSGGGGQGFALPDSSNVLAQAGQRIVAGATEAGSAVANFVQGRIYGAPQTAPVYDPGRYVAPTLGSPDANDFGISALPGPGSSSSTPTYKRAQKKDFTTGSITPVDPTQYILQGQKQQLGPEESVVEGICVSTGSQMVPSRVQLGDFMAKVKQTNDVQYLCYLLGEQLNHPDWKSRLRALYAINEMIVNQVPPTQQYFVTDGWAPLVSLTVSPQKTVKDLAVKIISFINPEALPPKQAQQEVVYFPPSNVVQPQPVVHQQPRSTHVAEIAAVEVEPELTAKEKNMNTLFRSLEAPASERKLSKGGPGGGSLFGGLEVAGQQPKAPKNKAPVSMPSVVTIPAEQHPQTPVTAPAGGTSLLGPGDFCLLDPTQASRPRQSSKSQIESVFNEQSTKAVLQNEIEKQPNWPAWSSFEQQTTFSGAPAIPTTFPVAGASIYSYPATSPRAAPTPYTYPVATANYGYTPASSYYGANKAAPVPQKKDPFDFGDLKNIDAMLN